MQNTINLLINHGLKHRSANLFDCPVGHQSKNYNLSVFKANDGNYLIKCNCPSCSYNNAQSVSKFLNLPFNYEQSTKFDGQLIENGYAIDNVISTEVIEYLNNRKIENNAIRDFDIKSGKINDKTVFFISCDYGYFWRDIHASTTSDKKCGFTKGSKITPFNIDNIKKEHKYIFICEGQLDALSIIQCNFEDVSSVALCTNNANEELFKHENLKDKILIYALDNENNEENAKIINHCHLSFTSILKKYAVKDVNDLLVKIGQNKLADEIEEFLNNSINEKNILDSIDDILNEEKNNIKIASGFTKLDEHLKGGFKNGLYVIGAPSNSGKSAILLQLAEQIAKQNVNVLYFSLEMVKFEHLQRIATKKNSYSEDLEELKQTLKNESYLKNLFIFDDNEELEDIFFICEKFKFLSKKPFMILIDYLQILTSKENQNENEVYRLKHLVTELKKLSKMAPTLIISSLNRASVKDIEKADITAFAGSGSIEYSVNWAAVCNLNDNIFTMKVVKNRSGEKNITLKYDFSNLTFKERAFVNRQK